MVRISGVHIPDNKKVEIGLTAIFGIGRVTSRDILEKAKIDSSQKIKDLSSKDFENIKKILEEDYKIEGRLRQEILSNIKRLELINCWRGLRHRKNLPVRGQRTRVNSRTVRGNTRRTAGSGRSKSPSAK